MSEVQNPELDRLRLLVAQVEAVLPALGGNQEAVMAPLQAAQAALQDTLDAAAKSVAARAYAARIDSFARRNGLPTLREIRARGLY